MFLVVCERIIFAFQRRERSPPPSVSSTTLVADDEYSETSHTVSAKGPSCDTQPTAGPSCYRSTPTRTATMPERQCFGDKALPSNEQGTDTQTTSLFEDLCVQLSIANSRSCSEQNPDKPHEPPPMSAADPTQKATRCRADGTPKFTSISSQVRWAERSDLEPPTLCNIL